MNQKWTRAICTVKPSGLILTSHTFSGYINSGLEKVRSRTGSRGHYKQFMDIAINSGLEKVYAKTQKQKDV